MKLGTSLRFLFPTSPQSHEAFRRALAAAPAGSFIERPMGAYDTAAQARNWEPDLIFLLVLPPILYTTAFFTPLRSLGANLGNISPSRSA